MGVDDGVLGGEYRVNNRLLTYSIKVRNNVSNRVRGMEYKDTQALGCVVANLIACITKGSRLVYSRRTTNSRKVGRNEITTRRIMKAIDFLEKEGYLVNFVGKAHWDEDKRVASYVLPTEKFNSVFCIDTLIEVCMKDYQDAFQVIELRDVEKMPIKYRETEIIKEMKEVVKSLNEMNEKAVVLDGNGKPLVNFYCRIFNEEFSYGGRFYRADVLQLKNKNTHERLDITIDGERVVEIDFSNLHFRIAAANEGVAIFEDVPIDVYSGMLEDETNPVERQIVKLAVNIMFNCRDERTARSAIQSEINKLSPKDRKTYSLGNAKSVMLLIEDAYPEFMCLFMREDSYGRKLQNMDSNLANEILKCMIAEGIVCLPCHDSFIVQRKHESRLMEVMGDCFRKQFNIQCDVPVTLSYQDDGVLVQHKVLC